MLIIAAPRHSFFVAADGQRRPYYEASPGVSEPALPKEAWPAAVASLVAARECGQMLQTAVVAHLARLCGKSTRTMWRWVEHGGADPSAASLRTLS